MHDGVEQGFADGLRRVVPPVDPVQPRKLRAGAIVPVDEIISLLQLGEQGSAQLAPVVKNGFLRPLENGELDQMDALIGKQ